MTLTATMSVGCTTMIDFYNKVTGQREPAYVATADNIRRPAADGETPTDTPEPVMPASVPPATVAEAEAADRLLGRWSILEAEGKAVNAAEGEEHPYLAFDSTAVNVAILKVYAYTGCNTLNGAFALTGKSGVEKVGEFATTMRLCPDAETEAAIISAFNSMVSYHLEHHENTYQLSFLNERGSIVLVAGRTDMSFLDGAWQVTEIQPIKIEYDAMPEPMQLVFDMNEGRLHGNTGCNVLNATVSTSDSHPNSLTITNPLTTRMACPNAGLEQQLTNALSRVASAAPGRHSTVYLLDEAGNKVITLHRVHPEL